MRPGQLAGDALFCCAWALVAHSAEKASKYINRNMGESVKRVFRKYVFPYVQRYAFSPNVLLLCTDKPDT